MKKILFLGAGSKNDPGFEDVKINGVAYLEYMAHKGVSVTDPIVVQSCHNSHNLVEYHSKQINRVIEQHGHRVVVVLNGGLYFSLPSIIAKDITCPVISCPVDLEAYGAFLLPLSCACIAGAGIDRKIDGTNRYGTEQRQRALVLAERMLNLEETSVAVKGNGDLSALEDHLKNLNIPLSDKSSIVLTYGSCPERDTGEERIQVWADTGEDLNNILYKPAAEKTLSNAPNTIQVRGAQNLAVYAAKILSLQRPDIREKIKNFAQEKRRGYEGRDLIKELNL